jgi:hypothetical protein
MFIYKDRLQILVVEEKPGEAQSTVSWRRTSGFAVEIRVVESKKALVKWQAIEFKPSHVICLNE